jgi:TonB family protein
MLAGLLAFVPSMVGNSAGTADSIGPLRQAISAGAVHRALGAKGTIGAVTARGGLDKEIVRRVVRRHLADVEGCYEKGLKREPKLAGSLKVKFTVATGGRASSASVVSSTLGDSRMEKCVVDAVKSWEYPQNMCGCETAITITFEFSPEQL